MRDSQLLNQATLSHIQEDHKLHIHCHENLKNFTPRQASEMKDIVIIHW